MKNVIVTGSNGFLGKNLCEKLLKDRDIELIKVDRSTSNSQLKEHLKKADTIVHLAATMRPNNDSEFDKVNFSLTEQILKDLENNSMRFIFTSSIQAELDNPYGRSKLRAENSIIKWSKRTENKANIIRLPNIFGRYAKPNYSSVVATFCYNLVNGRPLEIHDNQRILKLAYIDDVIDLIISCVKGLVDDTYPKIDRIYTINLPDLSDKLKRIDLFYKKQSKYVPLDDLDKLLNETYCYYLNNEKSN